MTPTPSPSPGPSVPGPLEVETPATRTTLTGDRSYVLGRGRDADVVVEHAKVSRRHLALEPDGDGWLARDTSANGVGGTGRGSRRRSGSATRPSGCGSARPTGRRSS
jgi:pSer/pThr/pTyr-binding forkhead associated (FHA) protein